MRTQLFRWMMMSLLLALAMAVLLWPASLPVSGQAGNEWRVWMKVSPCSGRTDWVSVARENPTYGGGGPFFQIFPGSHAWRTFAEAMAEANVLRGSSLFSSYCCREYSVWKNIQTGKLSVVQGKFGNAGYGWQFVKGDLCCDEAFALAGLSPNCGGGSANGAHWQVCETYSGTICGNWTFGSNGRGQGQWGSVQADLSLTVNGRDVTVTRRDRTSSLQATYHGTLSADGTQVTGRVDWCCDNLGSRSGTWRAQIVGGRIGGGNRGGSGGGNSGGNSGGSGGGGGSARLQLVEVKQDPPCSTWGNITSCNPNGGQVSWYNTNYQWNSPPQQVGPEGFTITLNASQNRPSNDRVSTGIQMSGGGFELNPPNASVPVGAPNQPMSGSLTVTVKPPRNPTGDYYLKIGVFWGPGWTYHYRAVR